MENEDLTKIILIIFAFFVGVLLIVWLSSLIFFKNHNKMKFQYTSFEFLKKMLKDNDLKKTEIVWKNRIIKGWNYSLKHDEVSMRLREKDLRNFSAIYNALFIFYQIYEKKISWHNRIFWLKMFSGVIILSFMLFIVVAILYGIKLQVNIDIKTMYLIIQYLSFVGIILIVVGWFGWTSTVENYRRDILDLASDYFEDDILKKLKWWSAFKSIAPFSENIFI